MSNQHPSTPVKVPASAASYTPATLDADLRSHINSSLLRGGHVARIQEHLLHALNAEANNWPTTVQTHALSLLRSGEATTFPELLSRVIDDVRQETSLAPASSSSSSSATEANGNGSATASGSPQVNGGSATRKTNGTSDHAAPPPRPGEATNLSGPSTGGSLAVPRAVVEEALRATREALEAVCEIDENGAT